MLRGYSEEKNKKERSKKDAVLFIKQKIDSAKWFIEAIKQLFRKSFRKCRKKS